MRTLIAAALATAVATGVSRQQARAPSVDMVLTSYREGLSSATHLGHWPAPSAGAATFLVANSSGVGVGPGSIYFGVFIEGHGTICSLTVPCTLAPGDSVEEGEPGAPMSCGKAEIPAGAVVHLEYLSTCAVPPMWNLVAGFEWFR